MAPGYHRREARATSTPCPRVGAEVIIARMTRTTHSPLADLAPTTTQTVSRLKSPRLDTLGGRINEDSRCTRPSATFWSVIAVALVALFAPRPALAQALGAKGRIAISVEDVTGYYAEKHTYDNLNDNEISDSRSHLSLLLRDGARVGVNYFLLPQVSLGGNLGLEIQDRSRSQPDGPGTNVVDGDADYSFLLHAKIGYLLPISGRAGFWFRGGPGVRRTTVHPQGMVDTNNRYKITETHWLLGLDALFVVAPSPTFGIFAGPCADFSVIGKHKETDIAPNVEDFSHSAHYRRLGGGLGVMGMF